tara:strand:+ start:266 stop:499 length:234 start_codon:yes stop_codon:yes gene_type:complete
MISDEDIRLNEELRKKIENRLRPVFEQEDKQKKQKECKMIKYILEIIYHYSTALTSWSWIKLYGDRRKGYGYKKRKV